MTENMTEIPCKTCENVATIDHLIKDASIVDASFTDLIRKKAKLVIEGKLQAIEKKIEEIIDKRIESIVAGTLGFSNSYGGRWEVDSRNSSFTYQHISAKAKERAKFMVDMFLGTDAGIFIDDKIFRELKKSTKERFEIEVRHQIRTLIAEEANTRAKEMVTRIVADATAGVFKDLKRDLDPRDKKKESDK